MAEEVFRFVNARPAHKPPEDDVIRRFASYGEGRSPFHEKLAALEGREARERASAMAQELLSQDGVDRKALKNLLAAVDAAVDQPTAGAARAAAESALDMPLDQYLDGEAARGLKNALWDRLYAHTLAPEEKPEQRGRVFEGIRALHYLSLLAGLKPEDTPLTRKQLDATRPLLPKGVVPSADQGGRQDQSDKDSKEVLRRLDEVHGRVVTVNGVIDNLRNGDRVYKAETLRRAPKGPVIRTEPARPATGVGRAADRPPNGDAPTLEQRIEAVPKPAPWVFEEFGQKTLPKNTFRYLNARKTGLLEKEVLEVIAALEEERYNAVYKFVSTLPPAGMQYVRSSPKFEFVLKEAAIPGYTILPFDPPEAVFDPGSATARGIQPLGIGDLLVVRQDLLRYTAGEVAHIENVLKSEFKTRMHSRLRETEEIIITETERMEETEKDLQTTERFELTKEAEKTIESKMSLDAGVSVTASYGPVSVTAHADFALDESSSESSRTASTFAREITEKSVQRIMQRSREERTRRTLERFEEKNEHGFDNKTGAGHVIGVYRWVDKYYRARLVNYGRRLLLEFLIPEPAAFYLHLVSNKPLEGVTLEKPEEPRIYGRRLEPGDLTKSNVNYYVAKYNVQDVEPYPAEVVRVSAAFAEAAGANENTAMAKSAEKLQVPDGYKCRDVFGEMNYQGISGTSFFLEVLIAGQEWGSVTAADLEGIIPISINGWATAFNVNVVAICELKEETKKAWQLKTYASIMTGYESALAAYNEQVAAAEIQAGVEIEGRNPEFNRKIEQDELRKGALRMLTNNFAKTRVSGAWRYGEMFNAMKANGQYGYPEFETEEAMIEGRILQFFEQGFEWNNMTYRFYPYFWGRKARWNITFPLTDTDPQFIDFLRAGAARVIIPVHPAYNETMLHYMGTNEIWNGGVPPTLDDPLFISIVDELKSDAGGDLDEELPECEAESPYPCQVDEWEIKLPTTLVYLQEDASLPDMTTP